MGVRMPVCDEDRRRIRRTTTRLRVTYGAGFVFLLFTGVLPGPMGVFSRATDPFGGTVPQIRTMVFAALALVAMWFVRFVIRYSREPARPVQLDYERAQGGYVWLRGADPRCLMQLPSVTPAR